MTLPDRASTSTVPKPSGGSTRRLRQVHHGKAVISTLLHTHLVHTLIDRRICELRLASPETGRHISLPVSYVECGGDLLVLIDAAGSNRWWRVFSMPYPVRVLRNRRWRQGLARTVCAGQPGWRRAQGAYLERFPHNLLSDADIYLVITLRPDGTDHPGTSARPRR